MNLTIKTVKGVGWSGISQITIQGFQLTVKIILARLLLPEDFGIIGMALIFTVLMQTVNELGLSAAIIQRKNINNTHLSTSFWISILMGVILCAVTIIASPFIAVFFKKELIQPVISILSIGFILGSFGTVHRTLLTKKIDFKNVAIAEAGAAAFSGITSIVLAFFGFGVWSLVIGSLMGNLGRSVLLWVICSWRPSMILDLKSFKELFEFGKNVMGSRILNYIDSNADYLLIGKFLDTTSLGLYTLAYQMAIFPLSKVSSVIARVSFPAFSTIQGDNVKLRIGYLKVVKYTSLITFPLLAGLAVIAPEFIPIAIGEKWMPMVLPLQILCIAGAIKSVGTHVGSILLSKGRSDIGFRWNMFTVIVIPLAVLIGVKYGIIGVAIAVTIMSLLLSLIIQKITDNLIDLNLFDFFKVLYPATICSFILIISVVVFQKISILIYLQGILSIVGSIITGAVFYVIAVRIIDNNSIKEIRVLIKQMKGN